MSVVDRPAQQEAQERQVEDVEADVAAERRVGHAPVAAVGEEEHRLPVAAPCGPGAERKEEAIATKVSADADAARRVRHLEAAEPSDRCLRRDPPSEPDAHQRRHEQRQEADAEEPDLRPEPRLEHVATAERVVPHDVGDEVDDAAEQPEHDDQGATIPATMRASAATERRPSRGGRPGRRRSRHLRLRRPCRYRRSSSDGGGLARRRRRRSASRSWRARYGRPSRRASCSAWRRCSSSSSLSNQLDIRAARTSGGSRRSSPGPGCGSASSPAA